MMSAKKPRDVAATADITLLARAAASRSPKEPFSDPWAEKIAESLYGTTESLMALKENSGIMTREYYFDRIVAEVLEHRKGARVLNIGAGYDARSYRLSDYAEVWYDLDLPHVIESRRRYFKEDESHVFLAADALKDDFLQDIPAPLDLVYSSGVFMYMPLKELNGLFARLAEHSPGVRVIFDSCSPVFCRYPHLVSRSLEPELFGGWGLYYRDTEERVRELFPALRDIHLSNYTQEGIVQRLPLLMKLGFFCFRPFFSDCRLVSARIGGE